MRGRKNDIGLPFSEMEKAGKKVELWFEQGWNIGDRGSSGVVVVVAGGLSLLLCVE